MGFTTALLLDTATRLPHAAFLDWCRGVVAQAVRVGIDEVYLEIGSRGQATDPSAVDPFVLAAAIGEWTEQLQLAVVTPPFARLAPTLAARYASALELLLPARIRLVVTGDPQTGVAKLQEAVEVVDLLLRTTSPTYSGAYWSLASAWNEPRGPRPVPVALWVHRREEVAIVDRVAVTVNRVLVDSEILGQFESARPTAVELFAVVRAQSPEEIDTEISRARSFGVTGVVVALSPDARFDREAMVDQLRDL